MLSGFSIFGTSAMTIEFTILGRQRVVKKNLMAAMKSDWMIFQHVLKNLAVNPSGPRAMSSGMEKRVVFISSSITALVISRSFDSVVARGKWC
ncbi:hypothetical protein OIU85_008739 [Salix viminalis]|uniref:Uncharacterized protein n=1 Tax=Salix viminalis TaxID=40686 RepID=A0A9Q0NYL7_SALVM|nr:hypothetical protein OIU85_008739 [Salix viminalis]